MTTKVYEGEIVEPGRIRELPRDGAGRPVPWFVHWDAESGEADFRVIGAGKFEKALKEKRCWVCGQRLGVYQAFVVGPMCAVNRTTSEPPSHLECANYSVRACPFLTTPKMHRRTRDLPEDYAEPAGFHLERNPGVALIWVSRSYRTFEDGRGGILLEMGPAIGTFWYAHGREATRQEVSQSINSGLPFLRKLAQDEGPRALKALDRALRETLELLPAT